jgi:hypothetical protein
VARLEYDGSAELQYQEQHPMVVFKATKDPDNLYLDQAMRAPDSANFKKAMLKEVRDHETRGHWVIIRRNEVPEGSIVLPAVWAMKRKRDIKTRKIFKWKARLNLGGHKERPELDYGKTYSPVVAWPTIRLFLVHFLLRGWSTRQLDFVLAYPQADSPGTKYLEIPRGFNHEGNRRSHVLKVLRNIYGSHEAGRTWFIYATSYLKKLGFVQSTIDPCVFYYKKCVLLLYVDDVIIGGPTSTDLDDLVQVIKDNVDLEDQGEIEDYIGVNVSRNDDGSITLSQPHLIASILKDLRLTNDSKTATTPALSSVLLHADLEGEPHDGNFEMRSVIGKLNYLEKCTRPELGYAVHQCARFMANPKKSHAQAVKRIGRYLLGTQTRGTILRPDKTRSFECYVDAGFAGDWASHIADQAIHDPNTARSRTGYVIMFAGVPLIWASKLQVEICLSSSESEMVALSAAARECIFLIRLIKDAQVTGGLDLNLSDSQIHCRILEDNQSTIALADEPKIRPRTKHINQKYWHFRHFLRENAGILSIQWISSAENIADIFTKPLSERLFVKFAAKLGSWLFATASTLERECDDPADIEAESTVGSSTTPTTS